MAVCGVAVGWEPTKQNRRGVASPRHLRLEDEKGASGRLGCVRVLSDLDRKNGLDSGCLEGGDVATCPGLPKVNAESVRVLSDPERRNVLDPGNLDGGDAATKNTSIMLYSEMENGLDCTIKASLNFSNLGNAISLKKLIGKGIPPDLWPKVWFSLSGAAKKKSTVPNSYYNDLIVAVEGKGYTCH
ncbi:hypothetical protein AgCh_017652 [Apium graveolens]